MSRPITTLDAVILRSTPYGEADLIVTVLARGRGKCSAFARSARRSKKRFSGALEPLARVRLEVVERRNSDWLDLRSAAVERSFLGIRDDLDRLAHASYGAELVRELLEERVPADALLDLLLSFFELLSTSSASSLRLRSFELAALEKAGYAPELERCVRCSKPSAQIQNPFFDASGGGLSCSQCAGRWAQKLEPAALALMLALSRGGMEAAEQAEERDLPMESVGRILRHFVSQHVDRELRSLAFIHEVGAPA